MLHGTCECKGVIFEVERVEPVGLHCYCTTCRTIAGAPFSSVVMCKREDFTLSAGQELLTGYRSSPDFNRMHCGRCHAPIWGEVTNRTAPLFVSAGALDPATIAHVVFDHIFTRSLVPWHHILDNRPRFATFREGGAAARIEEYAAAHNEGVRSHDFNALTALFHRDGELVFRGIAAGPFVGRAGVHAGFCESPPTDELVISDIHEIDAEIAEASYAWARTPENAEGTIRLESEKGQIRRLIVTSSAASSDLHGMLAQWPNRLRSSP